MQPQKLAPTTEVGCALQKYNTFSEKRAKTLTIFLHYFPDFLAILIKQNKATPKWRNNLLWSMGNSCKMILC
jgi:hypothetical protein